MPSIPFWKLRRLAPRLLRVLERHAARDPSLGAYLLTLKPTAELFISVFDLLEILETERALELGQGKAAVEVLIRSMNAWAGQVAGTKAIPGFVASAYGASPDVPDDTIKDAERLLGTVKKHHELDPEAMPFAPALLEDLGAALEKARVEWSQAEAIKSQHQDLVVKNRENAEKFSDLLISFRRALATFVGRSHPDYQTLRSSRIAREVLEEGEAADLPPSLIPTEGAGEAEGASEPKAEAVTPTPGDQEAHTG
jgi:hypothetical protein